MSVQQMVHTIGIPGHDGDGFTAPEAATVRAGLDRVVPPTAGAPGDYLVQGKTEPLFIRGSFSPVMFGAVGDGVTDDYDAVVEAIAALGPGGGTLDVADKMFYCRQAVVITTPVYITSGQSGRTGGLLFPWGSDGVVFDSIGMSGGGVGPVKIYTQYSSSTAPAGTGNGLKIRTATIRLDRCDVRGFGGNNIDIWGNTVTDVINANLGLAFQITSAFSGGHGIFIDGADANVWSFHNANVTYNRGYGIYNTALYQNNFYAPHALNNNMAGDQIDYFDDAWSSRWDNPYSEGAHKFVISNSSIDGRVEAGGNGAPTIWAGSAGSLTQAMSIPNANKWIVYHDGELLTNPRQRGAAGDVIRWVMDNPASGALTLRHDGISSDLAMFSKGAGAGAVTFKAGQFAVFNKAAVGQRPALANLSGATLAQIEERLNTLTQHQRDFGFMAT